MDATRQILVAGFCTEDKIDDTSYFGGAAGGIALNLGSLGVGVGILSALGSDAFSKRYLDELQKRNVNCELIVQTLEKLPQLGVVGSENSESARVFNDNGALHVIEHLTPLPEVINQYQYLHAVNTPRMLCDYLAHNFGGTFSYCPGSLFFRDPESLSEAYLNKSTLVFCNEAEFTLLSQKVDIGNLFNKNLKVLVVTLGAAGVRVVQKDSSHQYPALPIPHVVDTTGAGDGFFVGFMNSYIQGEHDIDICVRSGLEKAARAVEQKGVTLKSD